MVFRPLTPQVCKTCDKPCTLTTHALSEKEEHLSSFASSPSQYPITPSKSFSSSKGGESSMVFRPLTPQVCVTSNTSHSNIKMRPPQQEGQTERLAYNQAKYPVTTTVTWAESYRSSKGRESSLVFRPLTPQLCVTSNTSHSSIKMRPPQQEGQTERLANNQAKYPVTTTETWAESFRSSKSGESSLVFRPLTPQVCDTSNTSHSSIKMRPPQQEGQTERLAYNQAKYPVTTTETWAELLQQATSRRTVSSPVDSISSIGSEWIKKDSSIAGKIVSQSTPVKYLSELDQEKGIIEEPDLTLLGSDLSTITCGRQDNDLHRTQTSEKDFDITQDSVAEDHFTSAPCNSHRERSSVPPNVLEMKSIRNTSPYSVIGKEVEASSPLLTEGSLTESLLSFQKHEQSLCTGLLEGTSKSFHELTQHSTENLSPYEARFTE
ncbi:uncharacterized protein LOC111088195 isoform X2 [Limulus polyphemus]|uniref:Uncharacterized protein LOC111088195 isoform X2 n=1 Tax=Limulus polyphemus TaxID=6850 RepID=A0ABM1TBG0_LIMPO|nr:uncharacterized protein LOC111088195 isoform X2 [Limulus polyphemus]